MDYFKTKDYWQKRKKLLHDYSYIRDFVSFLREYNMLRQPNKNWTIYPTRNFKSNKNKRLHPTFIPQRLNTNEIARTRITKQDHVTFYPFCLSFSDSFLAKAKFWADDRVLIYVNDKKHRIGFRFYLNRVHKYHKNRDLMSKNTLDAINNQPSLFRDKKQDIIYGYSLKFVRLKYENTEYISCVAKVTHLTKKHVWIKPNKPYIPIFDYIHNRWEVKL